MRPWARGAAGLQGDADGPCEWLWSLRSHGCIRASQKTSSDSCVCASASTKRSRNRESRADRGADRSEYQPPPRVAPRRAARLATGRAGDDGPGAAALTFQRRRRLRLLSVF